MLYFFYSFYFWLYWYFYPVFLSLFYVFVCSSHPRHKTTQHHNTTPMESDVWKGGTQVWISRHLYTTQYLNTTRHNATHMRHTAKHNIGQQHTYTHHYANAKTNYRPFLLPCAKQLYYTSQTLYCATLHDTTRHDTTVYYTELHCNTCRHTPSTVQYHTTPHHTTLHCTVLRYDTHYTLQWTS